ncbi:MAG: hypothetical protein IT252_12105 [Chitinophagaceae bacterium]|nr:hypothetical protein [Chitinophagaceae bacterium]
MTQFIKVTISVKPVGPQAYENKQVFLSSDTILLAKQSTNNSFSITVKPEYEAAIKEALGLHAKNEFSSIIATNKDANNLFEVVKA